MSACLLAMFVAVSSAAVMSSEMTSLTSDRPMPVVPAASDPHGPVIIKYTVLLSYPLTFVIGLAGNTLVLFVVSRYSAIRNRSVSNYYIWNLALADVLFVLTLPFFCYATWTGDWIFGSVTCKVSVCIYFRYLLTYCTPNYFVSQEAGHFYFHNFGRCSQL